MKRLVVVESPTKARTIRRFLPADEYQVEACMGHVRDLPGSAAEVPAKFKKEKWSRLGVNVADGFEPLYIVPSEKKKVVNRSGRPRRARTRDRPSRLRREASGARERGSRCSSQPTRDLS